MRVTFSQATYLLTYPCIAFDSIPMDVKCLCTSYHFVGNS